MIVLCTAAFMASLDVFIVNIAFASIGRTFRSSSVSGLSWTLNGYTILYASLMVPAGRLADRVGRRGTFLAGLGLFVMASVACAAAGTLWLLVAFRCLQAIGAAAMTPASLALVIESSSSRNRSANVQIWAATGSLAAVAGPVLGGLLVQASWRWVFLLNAPVGALAFVGALWLVPRDSRTQETSMPDLAGGALLALGVGALAFGLVNGSDWGWTGIRIVAAFAAAAVALMAFCARNRRHPQPVLDREVLRTPLFGWFNVVLVVLMVAFAADLLTTLLWLQGAWRYSVLDAGLAIVSGPLVVPVAAVAAERIAGATSAGHVIVAGCALFGVGAVMLALCATSSVDYTGAILPGWTISGVGFGFVLPTALAAASANVPGRLVATASGVLNMSRQLGAAMGVSLFVVVTNAGADGVAPASRLRGGWWLAAAAAAVAALLATRTVRGAAAMSLQEPTATDAATVPTAGADAVTNG
jgi:EmrB/QacA subfamily drug resistance transporter